MHDDLTRRRFHELSVAALGGLMAGSITGCDKLLMQKKETTEAKKDEAAEAEAAAKADLHICRGLNACKGKGSGGQNDCAGTSACATFAKHECAKLNECKGQGGCDEKPGQNQCKGKGSCQVPLMEHAWDRARKSLEQKMKAEGGKELGKAPLPRLTDS